MKRICDLKGKFSYNCSSKNANYYLCNSYFNPVMSFANFHCLKCNFNVENLTAIKVNQAKPNSVALAWSRLIVISKNKITAYEDKINMIPIPLKSHMLSKEYAKESILLGRHCDKNPMYDACSAKSKQFLVMQNLLYKGNFKDFISYHNMTESDLISIDEKSNIQLLADIYHLKNVLVYYHFIHTTGHFSS